MKGVQSMNIITQIIENLKKIFYTTENILHYLRALDIDKLDVICYNIGQSERGKIL